MLDKIFEPFSRWFQIVFGKNNFFLARCVFWFSIIFLIFQTLGIMYFSGGKYLEYTPILLANMFSSSLFLKLIASAKEKEKVYDESFRNTMNPERVYFSMHRSILAILCIYMISMNAFVFFTSKELQVKFMIFSICSTVILLTVAIFFMACTPLPKCDSKIKEFLKGFLPSTLKHVHSNI